LISPDVQQLATTSSDKTVKLWNLDGFTLDRTLTGHTRWVWDCVFSVDAAYLVTASSDATARLWDLSTGACSAVQCHAVHCSGCFGYCTACVLLRLWDLPTGACSAGAALGTVLRGDCCIAAVGIMASAQSFCSYIKDHCHLEAHLGKVFVSSHGTF
jgi:hypothetical protein